MTKTLLLSLACIALIAEESFVLKEQTVTATHLAHDELSYAAPVEIYTSQDIENSKSKNIYDFLGQETSVAVLPSYGNQFAQQLDIRGYGLANGHQNIVVVVNGRRMNNIDGIPQLLSSIPIDSIEKIEILKGAGGVEYGDGANAGVISITTKDFNGVNFKTYMGNFNTDYGSLGAGYADDLFSLSAFGDYYETQGQRDLNSDGIKQDSGRSKNGSLSLKLYPTDALELRAGWAATRINTNYANALTREQYKSDPTQAATPSYPGAPTFTNQHFDTDVWSLGASYDISSRWSIDANIFLEDKKSDYGSASSQSEYDYNSGDLSVKYVNEDFRFIAGTFAFNGKRDGWGSITSKDNLAGFIKADYTSGNHSLTSGLRIEKVTYEYKPDLGNDLKQDNTLEAYELGYNYKLNKKQSLFASFAHSYQAPDIDRFFITNYDSFYNTTVEFNKFLKPVKVNTYNLGYNNFTDKNKLKATLFYTDLSNEIYYDPNIVNPNSIFNGANTNLDKTSKLGFELYDKYLILENLYLSANYTYVEATIEKDVNKAIENKTLPGVSKHNLSASIGYAPTQESKLIASHTYRSSAYAANDFTNAFTQKQEAYHSTDVSAAYQYDKHIEIFAKIQNLFDEDNGIWIRDDAIYPVNFQRSFQIGLNGKF
jgi:iron complex outermembrane receptor protein